MKVVAPGAQEFLPPVARPSLAQLRSAAAHCEGCDLYKHATQTVFGAGAARAAIFLMGEQPGDREDIEGQPFVGPAGALLDKALLEAAIDRRKVYVTNAVKHFKWTPAPRGKRRLHAKPNAPQMRACRPWLEAEIKAVRPRVIVMMGATAAQSLMGPAFRVTKERGRPITGTSWADVLVATIHPSSILRAPRNADRRAQLAEFVEDLRVAAEAAEAT